MGDFRYYFDSEFERLYDLELNPNLSSKQQSKVKQLLGKLKFIDGLYYDLNTGESRSWNKFQDELDLLKQEVAKLLWDISSNNENTQYYISPYNSYIDLFSPEEIEEELDYISNNNTESENIFEFENSTYEMNEEDNSQDLHIIRKNRKKLFSPIKTMVIS